MDDEVTALSHSTLKKYLYSDFIRSIKESGVKLEAKPITIVTAICIFHKFIKIAKPKKYDLNLVSATCIYLAGKVEEDHLKARDIINVFHRMITGKKEPLELSAEYWNLRESLVRCELLILRLLKFQVNFDHPHKYLLHYWQSLSNWLHRDDAVNIPILRTSWSLLSDLYLHPVCMDYKPQHVAVAALDLSINCYGVQVPYNKDAVNCWQETLCESASIETLKIITLDMMHIYDLMT